MTLESYRPGSYTQALYTGDFPTITNDDELDRMVELYRRDAGSRLPPGEPPPSAALSPTPSLTTEPVADPEIYPTPIPAEGEATDYGGGSDEGPTAKPRTDYGGVDRRIKPVAEPPSYPEGDWKATAPPPPHGGRWVGEEISHTPSESKPETPSILGEGVRGVQRAGVGMLHGVEGVANTVEQKLADWTGSQWLKATAKSDKEALAKRMDEAAKDYAPTVANVTAAFDDPSNAPRYVAGKLGELIPMLAGYAAGGMPAMMIYGAMEGANKAYEESNGDWAATLAGAGVGLATWGAPVPFLKGAAGKSLLNNVTRATVGMPVVSTVSEALKPIPKAVAARDIGAYELPTKAEFAEAAAGGAIGGPVIGAHGYVNQRAQARAFNKGVPGPEQYGPLPEEQGPQLPPRPYPPRPEEYGPDLPPRPYPPRPEEQGPELPPRPYQPREQYGPDLPPRPYPPREGEPTKGSPETAPPSAAADPAATAAIDAAVNPPRTETPETIVPPVGESPTTVGENFTMGPGAKPGTDTFGNVGATRQEFRPTPEETVTPVREAPPAPARETTTDVTSAPDALRAAEAAGYKLEPDHLDPNRQVAKNPAGEVIGKGGTPEETIADAIRRNGAPYVDEAPPPTQPAAAPKPAEATPTETVVPVLTEAAPTPTPVAAPAILRKAQPAAAEEAIAKSQAKAEAPATETAVKPTQAAAAASGQPTTVVRRPTKRVEVTVGKRGEGVVAEESTAQTEAADAAEAAQQRRLAERRAEKLPARAQAARRTSLMASEAGRDIKDVQEAPATSKVTRGTPIEEVGEGMQIEATEGGIAETRSKTTTDKNLRYHDLLHDVLQGNKTVDQASEAAGTKEPGTRGRPRRNKDLADYLDNVVIPRAEKYNQVDQGHVERVVKQVQAEDKLTPEKQAAALKRLNKALRDKNPDTHEDYTNLREARFEELNKEMDARIAKRGRHELERERLEDIKEHRDELRGVEKGGDAEANAPWADPIVKASHRLAKRLMDLTVNRKLQERVERSDKDRTMDSVHDYLNDIVNDPGAKIAAPDMVEYARHLLRLLPDHVEAGSYKALADALQGSGHEQRIATKENPGTYFSEVNGHPVDAIGLHPKEQSHISHLEATLHEATHAVTFKYLDHLFQKVKNGESLNASEQKHVDTLDAILKETTRVRDEHAISDEEYDALDYAVRAAMGNNPAGPERIVQGKHEMVSQIMSSPYVRAVMGRTESSPEFKAAMKKLGYGEPATLWQAFKAFVKDVVGFKGKDSVLDRVLDPMTHIVEHSARFREAADMGLELNAPLRGRGEPSGRRWKSGDVPTDGLPSQWVRDKMRPFGEAFADSPLFSREGIKERLSEGGWKRGLASVGAKGGLLSSPTHKLTEFNQDVLPAGPQVMRARALIDRAASAYRDKWGDRVQGWARQLKYGRDVGSLMNDATLNETYLTDQPNLFTQRNAHLTPDQMTRAQELQDRFNNLSSEDRKLYSDVRNHYRESYDEQRRLEYEDVLKRYMPDITQGQAEALGEKMKTKAGIKEVINNPDVLSQAFGERWENSRALVKDIAKLQDAGFVQGDYFPLRRYGDYVVRYGEAGTKHFGMEKFERSSDASARRIGLQKEFEELAKTDKTAEGVRVSDVLNTRANPNRREFMPENAFADMERAMVKRGSTPEQIEQAKEAYTYAMLRRQVSSSQAQSRMRRTGVQGASEDAARTLTEHYHSTASLFGHLTHGAAETEAMRQARQQADAIERATGTPGSKVEIERSKKQLDALETRFTNKDPTVSKADLDHARQQHQWLEKPPTSIQAMRARETVNELDKRRAPIDGDDSTRFLGKAAGMFTGASWAYHLVRPAHLAIQVADAHANAQSFLGAAYGHGRAAAAIVRAMKDLGPSGLAKGFKNSVKAVMGDMQHSDWHVGDMLTQKLINLKPGDAAHEQAMRGLMDLAKDYGLVDHTQSREVQRMSRQGGFDFGDPTGGKYPWKNIASNMMNLFAVGEHTVDSTMRASILKAGYDLARSHGADVETAQRDAVKHAMDAMPVWGAWNKPRIATPRGPIAKELVPAMMQYKQYGFHMYSVMGGLVRKAAFRPEERAEALKAMAGLVASHSILAGVTANMMALPVVAMLGAWDLFSGKEKPHDYETDLRRAITDMGGETVGKFASSGLFGLAGAQQSRSLKLTNMVDVPEIRSFDKSGAGQFILQGMTGASGDVAGQLFEGMHEFFSGNWGRAAKMLAPRVIGDPIKAYQLGTEGVVDKRGRTITPASQVTLGQQAVQALGFNPYEPSLARQRRHAEEEYKGEFNYARQKAVDRYVLSGGRDMTAVRSYMNNEEFRRASPITYQQLRERLKEERKRETRPEFYGAMPTKREERGFREATRFY